VSCVRACAQGTKFPTDARKVELVQQLQQVSQSIVQLATKMGDALTPADERFIRALSISVKKFLETMGALDRQLKAHRSEQVQLIHSLKHDKAHATTTTASSSRQGTQSRPTTQ